MLNDKYRNKVEILAVSVDTHEQAQKMRDKLKDKPGLDYSMLSDPDHKVIDQYGLFNDKSKRPVPHPATYVIDRQGRVRWKFVETDYKLRPSNEEVLKQIQAVESGQKR